jgi:hypothetical protein
MALLEIAMAAAERSTHQICAETSGGPKKPGKMFISAGNNRLAIVCTVPEVEISNLHDAHPCPRPVACAVAGLPPSISSRWWRRTCGEYMPVA